MEEGSIAVSETNIVQVIQSICKKEREASKPCDVVTGVVESTNPLSIAISQKMILSDDFLMITSYFKSLNVSKGDKVVLIRCQGGQRFLILDKVVE